MRVERRLGDALWEAVQPELGRRVALRRLATGEDFDAERWPEHPGVVRLYAVTEGDDGTYLVLQLVPGARTLAECRRHRAGRRRRWVDEAGEIVAGAAHGRLTDHDILVGGDGRVWVTGFGRPAASDDEAALARIRAAQRARPAIAAAAAAGAVAVAGVAAVLTLGGDGDVPAAATPPVSEGATAVGSTLAPGDFRTVDCEGAAPSGSSTTCTISQTSLDGRPVVAPFNGVVRQWVVRGASGRVALRILRPTAGGYSRYNGTRYVTIENPGAAHAFGSDRLVLKGARFGLEIRPGGGVGVRSAVEGASTARFFGRVRAIPETLDPSGGEGQELLLRVDLVPQRPR